MKLTATWLRTLLLAAVAATGLGGCMPAGAATASPEGSGQAGFAPASVTFVSPSSGFVLGTVHCGQRARCPALLGTRDGGRHWQRLQAPPEPVGLADYFGVWGVRFADPLHGFVFGSTLWTTADGGATWSMIPKPDGVILSLEIVQRQVLAVTGHCTQQGGCGQLTLYRRPLGRGPWHRAAGVSNLTGGISVRAGEAAMVDGSTVLLTIDGGQSFVRRTTPCAPFAPMQAVAVAVTGRGGLALACESQGFGGNRIKAVYLSSDLGATWHRTGAPQMSGNIGEFAAGGAGHLVMTAQSSASWLYASPDLGKHWRIALFRSTGGQAWHDLGFSTPAQGVVILGDASGDGNSQMFVSTDGGITWRQVRF